VDEARCVDLGAILELVMLDFLDRFSKPVKYTLIGLVGGILGALLSLLLGVMDDMSSFVSLPIGGAIGGYIAGRFRQRREPKS
jgi:LytS/YehU family sensor histidine kinase